MFLLIFSVALAHNTTGVTTATTMAAAVGNAPLALHIRSCAQRQRIEWMGDDPPSLWMYFLGGLRVLSPCWSDPKVPIVTLFGWYLGVHKRSQNRPNQEK